MSAFFPIDPESSGSRKAILFDNARLIDRDVDSLGALLARDGKIVLQTFAMYVPQAA